METTNESIFEIENDHVLQRQKKKEEHSKVLRTLNQLKEGQSFFVPSTFLSLITISKIVKTYDNERKEYFISYQKAPIKGSRVFFKPKIN